MNRRIKIAMALLMLLASMVANAAQDYLECNLPNGDQFILINKYDYSLLSKFHPHAASRVNQFGFLAYFKPKGDKVYKDSLGNFGRFDVSDELERRKACANFFIFENKTQSTGHEYQVVDGKVVNESIFYPQKKIISSLERSIDGNKLYTPDSPIPFQIRTDSGLLIEYGLTKRLFAESQNIIDAVIQIKSTDGGQTWSEPIITKDAKLFEIGKSILDQPAVAKPGKWKKGPG